MLQCCQSPGLITGFCTAIPPRMHEFRYHPGPRLMRTKQIQPQQQACSCLCKMFPLHLRFMTDTGSAGLLNWWSHLWFLTHQLRDTERSMHTIQLFNHLLPTLSFYNEPIQVCWEEIGIVKCCWHTANTFAVLSGSDQTFTAKKEMSAYFAKCVSSTVVFREYFYLTWRPVAVGCGGSSPACTHCLPSCFFWVLLHCCPR